MYGGKTEQAGAKDILMICDSSNVFVTQIVAGYTSGKTALMRIKVSSDDLLIADFANKQESTGCFLNDETSGDCLADPSYLALYRKGQFDESPWASN